MKLNFIRKYKAKRAEQKMHYDTLGRELTELMARSFTFKDIEAIGKDLFYTYSTHELEGVISDMTVSPLTAAARLVHECTKKRMLSVLISYIVQLEGNYLNGKIVSVYEIENLLYHLTENGYRYDHKMRKFVSLDSEKEKLPNWGALKEGKEYEIVILSIDICDNSAYVNEYGAAVMETVYNRLHTFLEQTVHEYKGRIWSWAGDGGLLAFRGYQKTGDAVNCAIAIQLAMPIFNLKTEAKVKEPIRLRIGMDCGSMRFFNDVGRIVSNAINYAAHLEKKGTPPAGLSISELVYEKIPKRLKILFQNKKAFEDRSAYSLAFDHEACFGLDEEKAVDSAQET